MPFKNDVVKIQPGHDRDKHGHLAFHNPPKFLFLWSGLLQSILSQALTFLFSGKYHNHRCAIYKGEGGVNVPGTGELVLGYGYIYWNYSKGLEAKRAVAVDLINHIVLNWNPDEPVDSMLSLAAEYLQTYAKPYQKVEKDTIVSELKAAIEATHSGNPFGGNALSRFFDWNPFENPKRFIDRDYQRYCLKRFNNMTDAEIDQKYADEDLGESLYKSINKALRERHSGEWRSICCCQPRRNGTDLKFWVNTGQRTNLDGWKTREELEAFIASGEKIKDLPRE